MHPNNTRNVNIRISEESYFRRGVATDWAAWLSLLAGTVTQRYESGFDWVCHLKHPPLRRNNVRKIISKFSNYKHTLVWELATNCWKGVLRNFSQMICLFSNSASRRDSAGSARTFFSESKVTSCSTCFCHIHNSIINEYTYEIKLKLEIYPSEPWRGWIALYFEIDVG